MGVIQTFINCMFGPRLYRVYKVTVNERAIEHKTYIPSKLERWGNRVVVSFAAIWSISLYTIPLVAIFMYEHRYSTLENVYFLGKILAGASSILITSLIVRGYARFSNGVYYKFIQELRNANDRSDRATKDKLRQYEYDFWAMPLDYSSKYVRTQEQLESSNRARNVRARTTTVQKLTAQKRSLSPLIELPYKLIVYIVAHTVAVKLIYPGSAFIVNWALRSTLEKGRIDLISQGGVRFKLRTPDQNFIDSMFIDRRNVTPEGTVLVICCEGNCGFYENGILVTPLKKGYSILGWNHPGFGDSTGSPYPKQEEHAVDTIMRFAINYLGFTEENIIIYGWSIGGYTATYAAMNYQKINSLILDATFDSVLPLAHAVTPSYLHGLTTRVILDHFYLCVSEYLLCYNGPVLIVRRTEDEIVSAPTNDLDGNRANALLLYLLRERYPYTFPEDYFTYYKVMTVLRAKPARKKKLLSLINAYSPLCLYKIGAEIYGNGGTVTFPSELGKDADLITKQGHLLFLMSKYMKDQQSTHCVPLLENLFTPAWNEKSAYMYVVNAAMTAQQAIGEEFPLEQSSGSATLHQSKFDSTSATKPCDKGLDPIDVRMKLIGGNTEAEDSLYVCSLEASAAEMAALEGIRPKPLLTSDQDANSEHSNYVYESDLDSINLDFLDLETSDEEGSGQKAQIPKTTVSGGNTLERSMQEEISERQHP